MESRIQTVLDSFTWIDTRLDREKGGGGGGWGEVSKLLGSKVGSEIAKQLN